MSRQKLFPRDINNIARDSDTMYSVHFDLNNIVYSAQQKKCIFDICNTILSRFNCNTV